MVDQSRVRAIPVRPARDRIVCAATMNVLDTQEHCRFRILPHAAARLE
ncbi:hypothetical protein ACIBM4_05685 [Streptomyces sp. NPDC050256]